MDPYHFLIVASSLILAAAIVFSVGVWALVKALSRQSKHVDDLQQYLMASSSPQGLLIAREVRKEDDGEPSLRRRDQRPNEVID